MGAMKNFIMAPCDQSKDQLNSWDIPLAVAGECVSTPLVLGERRYGSASIVSENLPDLLAREVALAEFKVPPENEPV
tara:strand:+ start:3885 stop:4115 length:231 start_codon:yes stop_codon:yes gene_type:complete